ncbi:MAG: DNA primase [Clostridia bacterium]|nr:DNA primase [Clostridia bacterium]
MRFSDTFLNDLRSKIDIEDLIARYAEVRGRGRTPVCLCPFHNEKTPSFVIYKDTQSYYCFGCGAGGDAITFIRNIENLDYTEAVRFLCERTGTDFPNDPVDDELTRQRRRCYEANREAARFFHAQLSQPHAQQAREYIQKRALTKETVVRFGLGYAPASWDALLKHMRSKGFSDQELILYDLARKTAKGSCIDAFRNRLIFPIIDLRGNVIAFGGRVLDDSKPKYLNTSDTVVYKKSQALYALNVAKNGNNDRLILCEGYMDVISLHQAGFTQAVAGLGTAFTPEQAKLLSRYCTELLICFDSDEAGIKATRRARKILADTDVKLRVVRMVGGKDPDEIIKKYGKERMREILEGAVNETEFALQSAKARFDTETADGKVGYLNEAVGVLAAIPNAVKRDVYITQLAGELQVSKAAIEAQVAKLYRNARKKEEKEVFGQAVKHLRGEDTPSPNPDKRRYPRAVKAEEHLLAALLANPAYLRKFASRLNEDVFMTPFNKRIFAAVSEKIEQNLSLMPSSFSATENEETVAYISMLLALSSQVGTTEKSFGDYLTILAQEKKKAERSESGPLTDADFLARIADCKKTDS